MELISHAGAFVIGVAVGVWSYRYLLRRSPEAVERLAAQARALRDRF